MSWDNHIPISGPTQGRGLPRHIPISGPMEGPAGETDEERERRIFLQYAREKVSGAIVPNLVSGTIQGAAGVAGLVQRLSGGLLGDPASTARISEAFEQAGAEEAARPEKWMPENIARGMRGVAGELPAQAAVGVATGPVGMIAFASAKEMNQAIHEGQKAGLEGTDLIMYVGMQGTIEAVPAALMNKFGYGGFESLFGKGAKKAVEGGIASALKKLGIKTIQELPEEIFTELGHYVENVASGVDPKSLNWAQVGETVEATLIQTVMQMGVAGAPGVARAAIDKGMAPEAAQAPMETPAVDDTIAPDIDTVAPDVIEAPIESVLNEETITLTKAEGARIAEDLGLEARPEVVARKWSSLVDAVAETKSDENAIEVARNVLSEARQITDAEHVSAVVAAGKLLNQRKELTATRAEASQAGNIGEYAEASRKLSDNLEAIDTLIAATDTAGTEIGRALNIRKLTLSRESFDIASVLQEIQAVQKPGVRISEKQKQEATAWVDSYAKALEEMAITEEAIRAEDEAREARVAQKVVAAHKPKRQVGRKIREKAVTEREDIKNRLRAMGHQIHDVSQVSVEGTYLIGRLGLTYVKEGAGTLVEVMERLQADMPDLNLTQSEVNRALIQRSPKSKARARSGAAKRKSRLLSLARMEVEIEDMANGITKKARGREPVNAEVAAMRKKLTKARTAFYYADIEAAKKERATQTINKLQDDLKNGLTNQKRNPKVVSPELASLHAKARAIRTESRIDNEIKAIQEQMRTGIFPEPKVKKRKPEDPRLQAKRIVLRKLRKEKEQMIANAAPWDAQRVIDEIVAAQKAAKGTIDVSFTLRQNIAQVLPHPFVTTGKFIKSLRTLFNEEAADRIQDGIENSPNFDNYMRAELTILDANSPDAQQRNEGFMGTLIERVPIYGRAVRASSRQAVAIGNLVRTQAFDRYLHNNPEATLQEIKAFADIANKTTGIGDVKLLGKSLRYWTWAFWTPKFVASRIQTPLLLHKYWKLPRVRKEIATEMVRAAGTAGTILGLMGWAGAQVEWLDVDDPDWMKIRIGNQRFDIFGGLQQVMRIVFRIGAIGKRRVMGESQEGSLYNQDPMELLGRFTTFKASPTASMISELLSGKTAVGEERTVPETLIRGLVPMVFEDVEDAWKIEGVERGILTAPVVAVGIGSGTYYDSETRVRQNMKKLIRAGRRAEAKRLQGAHNRRNPENKIVSVRVK